jgi:hypothetical protein
MKPRRSGEPTALAGSAGRRTPPPRRAPSPPASTGPHVIEDHAADGVKPDINDGWTAADLEVGASTKDDRAGEDGAVLGERSETWRCDRETRDAEGRQTMRVQ